MAVPRTRGDVYRRTPGSAGSRGGAIRGMAVQFDGLTELRRGLKKASPEFDKQIKGELRPLATRIRDKARGRAPVGRTGKLRSSIKHSLTQKEAALYSNLVYSKAHEWGTSGQANSQVQPRGVPIKIKRSQMLGNAVYSNRYIIEKRVIASFERVVIRNGFDD